jgi:hypothetical protein
MPLLGRLLALIVGRTLHINSSAANDTIDSNVDPVLKANVYNSVFNPNSTELWSQSQYICNTGNCTWPAVANMAIQPLCSDISVDMSMSCALVPVGNSSNCTVSLSNGFAAWFIDGGLNGIPMIIQTVQSRDAFVYTNQSLPVIQSILALYNASNPDSNILLTNQTNFIATECALAPCVRGAQATVKEAPIASPRRSIGLTWQIIQLVQTILTVHLLGSL